MLRFYAGGAKAGAGELTGACDNAQILIIGDPVLAESLFNVGEGSAFDKSQRVYGNIPVSLSACYSQPLLMHQVTRPNNSKWLAGQVQELPSYSVHQPNKQLLEGCKEGRISCLQHQQPQARPCLSKCWIAQALDILPLPSSAFLWLQTCNLKRTPGHSCVGFAVLLDAGH